MSTRCQIRFVCNGKPVDLYHHDGYFEGVGKEIHDALAAFRGRELDAERGEATGQR